MSRCKEALSQEHKAVILSKIEEVIHQLENHIDSVLGNGKKCRKKTAKK